MKVKKTFLLIFVMIITAVMLASCNSSGKNDITADGEDGSSGTVVSTDDQGNADTPDTVDFITVKYQSENKFKGKIEGSVSQVLSKNGGASTKITAVPALGYEFDKWSDGVTDASRSGDAPTENTAYTAYFKEKALELPIIVLSTDNGRDITSKDFYVSGKISVKNVDEKYLLDDLAMEISGRGNYTWGSTFNNDPMYNKRPYKIRLSEQQKLAGVGEGKSRRWVLLADHCDQSLLRNNTVYSFAKSLSGIVWQPAVQSVEVYLNGAYIGVYLLCEQVQVNQNKIPVSEDVSKNEVAFLAMFSNYASGWGTDSFSIDGMKYEIKSDLAESTDLANKQNSYIRSRVEACWRAVQSGDEETVKELMDLNSVIDTYIVQELFKNLDTGHDNFYMFAETDGKMYFGPVWDFDQCAGNANEDVDNPENIRGGNTQPWYSYLLSKQWFRQMLTERWNEIKDHVDEIPGMITGKAEAGYNSYCRNFDKWQIFGYQINRETYVRRFTTYKEHYEYFADFMVQRIKWLDDYWNGRIVVPGDYEFSGDGSEGSPYAIASADDFIAFSDIIAAGGRFEGVFFMQVADIDLTGVADYKGLGSEYSFAGVYDAAGHSITADIKGSDGCIFPYLEGTVMNLVTYGSINNSSYTGGIARSVRSSGKILNCASYMELVSSGNVGGITASNQPGAVISNCYFGGTVSSTDGQAAPICLWVEERGGTFLNNYFIEGTPNDTKNVNIDRQETAVSQNNISTTVSKLNESSDSGIWNEFLCTWKAEGSKAILEYETIEIGVNATEPITGGEARIYHNSHEKAAYIEGSGTYNFDSWGDGYDMSWFFDGRDGYFNSGAQTKIGGFMYGGDVMIEFETENTTLAGYAFITGNDSGSYYDRNPLEWYLYGSSDGENWTLLDHVEDSGIYAADHEYFGYGIEESARGEYSHYRIRFTKNLSGNQFSEFQLNEMYLYK